MADTWLPIEDALTDTFYRVWDAYSEMVVTGIKMSAVNLKGDPSGFVWFTGYTWGTVKSIQRPTHFMTMEKAPSPIA